MASNEHRKTFLLLSYWNSIKDDSKFPDISEVNIGEIGELWDYCFILDMSDKSNPEFQHFGSELIRIFGHDYTGEHLGDENMHTILADVSKFIDEVWLMESPVSHCGEVTIDDVISRYRSLIAPLSEDNDGTIRHLIGTTNFRTYD